MIHEASATSGSPSCGVARRRVPYLEMDIIIRQALTPDGYPRFGLVQEADASLSFC